MSRKLVLIEFVVNTDNFTAGQRYKCDPMSATSFCDKLKVAVRVGQGQPTAPAPETPEPSPVGTEPVDTTPAGVDADE